MDSNKGYLLQEHHVSEPDILILDEPTVGVDLKKCSASFYNMLEELNTKIHITLILVTHDLRAIIKE